MRRSPHVLVAFATSLAVASTLAPSASAAGAEAPPAAPSASASTSSAAIMPGEVDAKAALRTSPVLQYGGVGASGDVGVTHVGPGTVAIGGSLAYESCASTCWGAPLDLHQHQTWLEGRASYHIAAPRIGGLDVYPLVTIGVVFAGSTIRVGDATKYEGSSVAPAFGLGGGASYFFSRHFFVTGEATVRYAGGVYDYTLARGPARPHAGQGVDSWSANTLALALGVGARF